jgi:hypothetical protein
MRSSMTRLSADSRASITSSRASSPSLRASAAANARIRSRTSDGTFRFSRSMRRSCGDACGDVNEDAALCRARRAPSPMIHSAFGARAAGLVEVLLGTMLRVRVRNSPTLGPGASGRARTLALGSKSPSEAFASRAEPFGRRGDAQVRAQDGAVVGQNLNASCLGSRRGMRGGGALAGSRRARTFAMRPFRRTSSRTRISPRQFGHADRSIAKT